MMPKLTCSNCGGELVRQDKFCAACGIPVEWGESAPSGLQPGPKSSGKTGTSSALMCPLCGFENESDARSCASCGSLLQGRSGSTSQKNKHSPASPQSLPNAPPLKFIQSWKFTVSLAIVLVGVVVIMKTTQSGKLHSGEVSPHAEGVIKEIESLEKQVNASPQESQSLLRLANLYHDVKFFPKAIPIYERYLQLNPSNPDARVDLGTSYFELSFTDSVRGAEYLENAKNEIEKALTYAPKHQLGHFNLGIIMFHSGDMKIANEWFRKCAELDSTTEVGRKARQFLNQHSFNTRSTP